MSCYHKHNHSMQSTSVFIRAFTLSVLSAPFIAHAQQASTAQTKPDQAKIDCQALIRSTPTLTETDFINRKIPQSFSAKSRDEQFESAKAYAERVKKEKKQYLEKTAEEMAGKTLMFKMTSGDYGVSYNPDRGGYRASSVIIGTAKGRKDGNQVPYPTVTAASPDEPRTVNIGLGAKSEMSSHYGMAFVKSTLKHPFTKGGQSDFFFKYPVEKARAVGADATMVFVGVVQAPWSFHSFSSWTDLRAMKDYSLSTRYAAVNLICAAIVDPRSHTILHEFK